MWTVYILQLNDNTYYTGITNNLVRRLAQHKSGKGSKYVRGRLPFRVVYICHETDRSSASKLESKIKKMTRKNKEILVKGNWNLNAEEINLFCDNCGAVITMKRKDVDWPKFEISCAICSNIIKYEEEIN